MSSKENNFKEQFKQALISTAKVISEDYKLDVKKLDKDLNNKKTDFFDITNFQIKKYLIKTYLIILLVNLYIILLKKSGMNFLGAKCLKELEKI